jgi:peptidoglycan/xylan/chitin deacetylase (PgdA/CDA1 family)
MQRPIFLMYHSLAKAGHQPSDMYARFVVTTEAFEAQLALLKDKGYTSSTVTQYLNNPTASDKTVILTFDDALADFELAVPLLKKYGFTATLFVPTAFVGGRSSWMPGVDAHHPLLSWQDLRDLAKENIDIAAHGHAHLQLDNVPLAVAKADIERGKGLLEQHLGQKVSSFAYPYGYYTSGTQQLLKAAGFAGACSVDKRLSFTADTFALSRLTVAGGMSTNAFATPLTQRDDLWREACVSAKAVLWREARRWQRSLQTLSKPAIKRRESRPS